MPRRNRNTGQPHRKHRRGRITPISEQAWIRAMNPRWDERGSSKIETAVTLACVLSIALMGAVLFLGWFAPAEAKGTQIHPAVADYPKKARNPVVYVERLNGPRRWYYVELADGSQWMMTRCRNDEVTGSPRQTCWWNARTMGDRNGRSFAVTKGVKHWLCRKCKPVRACDRKGVN